MRPLIIFFLFIAPVAAVPIWSHSPLAAIAVVFASHMLVLYPTLRPSSEWLGPVVTSFRTRRREVWLTIDDGPDPVDTPLLLELFRRHSVNATFFVKGERAERNRDVIRKIIDAGHTVANHTYSHPSATFWCLPPGRIADEVDRCTAVLTEIVGAPPSLFRPAVGMKNPFVHPILRKRGLTLVGWSVRGFDGVGSDPERAAERIIRKAHAGAIILVHEGRSSGQQPSASVRCIQRVVEELSSRGFRFVIPEQTSLR